MSENKENNFLGLDGIEFAEWASPDSKKLHNLFVDFGFSKIGKHNAIAVELYEQNQIRFLLNKQEGSFGAKFSKVHGPSICSMGWRVKDADFALAEAVKRGAKKCLEGDYKRKDGSLVPAIYGIGDSIIYFIDSYGSSDDYSKIGFTPLATPELVEQKGFQIIDHMTNNVYKGTMEKWSKFYKTVFGFEDVRYFDIKGKKTGLTSYALKSPCGKFCIPINEADEKKSQINEYLDEYHGPGVQHLALLTVDILESLKAMESTSVEMLDILDSYYETIFDRVPNVTEDKNEIQKYNVLIDGDEEGYLLQIFTKNVVGPIFIEIIQRKNHHSFGEGNFQALFDSIERDQEKRGVL